MGLLEVRAIQKPSTTHHGSEPPFFSSPFTVLTRSSADGHLWGFCVLAAVIMQLEFFNNEHLSFSVDMFLFLLSIYLGEGPVSAVPTPQGPGSTSVTHGPSSQSTSRWDLRASTEVRCNQATSTRNTVERKCDSDQVGRENKGAKGRRFRAVRDRAEPGGAPSSLAAPRAEHSLLHHDVLMVSPHSGKTEGCAWHASLRNREKARDFTYPNAKLQTLGI